MRALRSAFTRRPRPGITKTPFFLVSLIAVSASRSRNEADCLFVSSSFSAKPRTRAVFVIVAAIETSSFVLPCPERPGRSAVGTSGRFLRVHTCETLSNDAGPEEPAAINLAALRDRCQRKKPGFHRNFAVFFGFSLENPEFWGFCRP